jgi:hypothetical protein
MASRWDHISFTILGVVLVVVSLYEILHHHYEFFLSGQEGGWTSYFAYFLLGLFFLVAGLIGLVRGMRSMRPAQPPV